MLKMYVNYLRTMIASKVKSEKGQGMVEYGLIIGLIAIVLITALGFMSGALENVFTAIQTKLNEVAPPAGT